jgi:hypothetical protein
MLTPKSVPMWNVAERDVALWIPNAYVCFLCIVFSVSGLLSGRFNHSRGQNYRIWRAHC